MEISPKLFSQNDDFSKNPAPHFYIIHPHQNLPKPRAPQDPIDMKSSQRTLRTLSDSSQDNFTVDVPAIGKFIRESGSKFSDAIGKRIYSFKSDVVMELDLPGKVIVRNKSGDRSHSELKGRISFFSRSNCRDCTAVRTYFKERRLKFVEINVDVYPEREKELIDRTGGSIVPQIFFNETLLGGLVALNSLRNSGLFDMKARELLRSKGSGLPERPIYGYDDMADDEREDEMVGVIRVLRKRLPIEDRLMKMKMVRNCFAGSEMVRVLIQQMIVNGRKEALMIGKELAKRHFIHHVFGKHDFEDGENFYRFLEHEPFIPKCYNFRELTNDNEPKCAAMISIKLAKIMTAILESYASDDRSHINYVAIGKSEEFRRYINLTNELHRINIQSLSDNEKLAFFVNLHNAMAIHGIIRGKSQESIIDRRSFLSDFQYIVGGHPYSISAIKNGILRSNHRPPYSLIKPFGSSDRQLELVLPKVNPLIHFGLCDGTRSSPKVRFFLPQGIDVELRSAAREFFRGNGMEVDLAKRTVYLSRLIKWFDSDFGQQKNILEWIANYLDASKAGLLMHLLGDGGPVNIVYQDYNWSANY